MSAACSHDDCWYSPCVAWLIRSLLLLLAVLACMALAAAQTAQAPGQLPLLVGTGPAGTSYSVPIQTLLFFTALSFLPAVLLMMTGFTRIVIVLSLLRQALGTQSSPPNQVIVGLSLFLTVFVMGPTLDRVYEDAYLPYSKNTIAVRAGAGQGRGADARVHGPADPAVRSVAVRAAGQAGAGRDRRRPCRCGCWCRPS